MVIKARDFGAFIPHYNVYTLVTKLKSLKTQMERKYNQVECIESTEKMWYLDSGCSRHMEGNISLFIDFVPKKKRFVTMEIKINELFLEKVVEVIPHLLLSPM
ncbi:hypothetical protein KIW84_061416 [Lathyrus oleraceus]|uniref:Retrovirus-related Pol polyprotein from transposon TNT 1-94-like beta-barrel domain-containing protein n=1 Tax=Pisum sativum TaxID=3888 RepID=A0A9D5A4F5_PEA|nr:hypothetical protein KIW84_061416 [Pisum sativum]